MVKARRGDSVFLQRSVPQDLAASGEIVADSHDVLVIRAVGDLEPKIQAAYGRNLRMILLPIGNRSEVIEYSLIPSVILEEIVRFVGNLDDAVPLVCGQDIFVTSRSYS